MFYPLKFVPVYKDYVWGGNAFKRFGRELPGSIIAESWEVSCHPNGLSVAANGPFKGVTLPELIAVYGTGIMGDKLPKRYMERFPLLVKFLDAEQTLSVQVHPDDEYAKENENGELGKNEMWYVVHAEPGAKIYRGLKDGLTKEEVHEAIRRGSLLQCMKEFPVKAGDAVYVDAGTLHAIGSGILIAEIQQNSDVTYRLYDFDRLDASGKPRALHIDKGLEVLNYVCKSCRNKIAGLYDEINAFDRVKYLISNDYFTVELLEVNRGFKHSAKNERFYIYTFVEGRGVIQSESGRTFVKAGESVLIPAGLGGYTLEGNFKALRIYMSLYRDELFDILIGRGFSEEDIRYGIAGCEIAFCTRTA